MPIDFEDDDLMEKKPLGFAASKELLGIDQSTYDNSGPSFADRIIANPDIPSGDVEDRRGEQGKEPFSRVLKGDAQQMLGGMKFTAQKWYDTAAETLGLKKKQTDESLFKELSRMTRQ